MNPPRGIDLRKERTCEMGRERGIVMHADGGGGSALHESERHAE